jgi:hypothetical protein
LGLLIYLVPSMPDHECQLQLKIGLPVSSQAALSTLRIGFGALSKLQIVWTRGYKDDASLHGRAYSFLDDDSNTLQRLIFQLRSASML